MMLPVKQADLKTLGLKSYGIGVGTPAVQYSVYKADIVNDGKFPINFGGINIEDAPDSEFYTPGMLSFYGKDKGAQLEGFKLTLENPDNFQKVLDHLLNKKDKFKLVFDNGKDDVERARVFSGKQNNITYLVLSMVNEKGKKVGYVEAISAKETPLLTSRLGGVFQYYNDYLQYRRNKAANFSYLDFIKETDDKFYKENNNLK
ncbi:hypothetical protein [Chryseobacterium sp. StRB126]|uniref:hypothetical protein n=1 Tax=Chryseobacterium sp. StRB126 TaxID=878220 RepID=UPI00118772AD|nr:hypothetical protein [Chryseobacterium sp. StRB126]